MLKKLKRLVELQHFAGEYLALRITPRNGGTDFDERIAYFRRWPPPPRYLACLADYLWDLRPWETEGEFDFDYGPYFTELERLGFGNRAEYERDLNDPRWLGDDPDDD